MPQTIQARRLRLGSRPRAGRFGVALLRFVIHEHVLIHSLLSARSTSHDLVLLVAHVLFFVFLLLTVYISKDLSDWRAVSIGCQQREAAAFPRRRQTRVK